MARTGRKVEVGPPQVADHAAVFGLWIEYDRPEPAGIAAEHYRRRRVTLSGSGMRQHRNVGIGKTALIEGIEHAEPTRVLVVAPVVAVRICQVFLQPGKHRGDRARVQDVLASEQVHPEWPAGKERLPHLEVRLHGVQHHSAATGAYPVDPALKLNRIVGADGEVKADGECLLFVARESLMNR